MSSFDKNAKKQAQYVGLSSDKTKHVFETVQVMGCGSAVLTFDAGEEIDARLKGKEGRLFDLTAAGKVKL